ncbi:MAG: hypothetical protein NUV50_03985 [Rhodospirillales bacterium]|nr:hypothetical protein [Rhodospirillales bacterium]
MSKVRGLWKLFVLIPLVGVVVGVGLIALTIAGWEVATSIAPEKTCEYYQSLVRDMAAPGFVPSDDCPWVKRGQIGHFTVNGVPFTIPRDYLWQGASDSDGPVYGLYIMMRYPEMEPAPPSPYHDLNVMVTVRSTSNHIECVKYKKCGSIARIRYLEESGIDRCASTLDKCDFAKWAPSKVVEIAGEGLKHFKTPTGNRDIFFSGDLLNPEFWFVCAPPPRNEQGGISTSCESSFQLDDKIYIDFDFRRRILVEHIRAVHEGVVRKLEKFTRTNTAAMTGEFGLEN